MVIQKRTTSKTAQSKIDFLKLEENIGHGTFGQIYVSKDREDNKVAVKKFTYSKEPVHLTTIRELKALKQIKSDYILPVIDIYVQNYTVHMVMPLYDIDLYKLIQKEALSLTTVKEIFYQMVKGVQDIHKAGYIHRDIKSANILLKKIVIGKPDNKKICVNDRDSHISEEDDASIDSNVIKNDLEADLKLKHGEINLEKRKIDQSYPFQQSYYDVKICDFGISKSKSSNMTPDTVTLWYRAPEVLLGSTTYTGSVDVWSLGCILLEFLGKKAIFSYDNEVDVLYGIIDLCGSINEETYPGVSSLAMFNKYKLKEGKNRIKERFEHLSKDAADLAYKMLCIDPSKRISIEECLSHPFLRHVNIEKV